MGTPDFNTLRTCFANPAAPSFAECDCNCDGDVGIPDFNSFRDQFASGPGPSGRACAGDPGNPCDTLPPPP